MPGTESQRKPVAPSMIARVVQGVRYVLSGNSPDQWFGPGQPIAPLAQEQADGRQFDYPVALNMQWVPRGTEAVTFDQLRALADSLDVLRLAIETRKDQIQKQSWVISPRDPDQKADSRCKLITDLLQYPDREHDWDTWLRMLLEDMFVIDAASIYPRATRGGGVYSLDLIDGATIKRVINADGRTPIAPEPAYQQILKGMPAVDYSRDELLYAVRNPRVHKIYGYSQTEQIIMTVNIAIRRQLSQLSFYSTGSTPDLLVGTPAGWNVDQIRQFKAYWDSLLSGNLENRRGTMFIPDGTRVIDTKERLLKDEYDEWLARIVCYCFSLPPTPFIKQMNRETANTAQDVAKEEGLGPLMKWVSSTMNQVIARWFGFPDLQFGWEQDHSLDQLEQAQIDQIYVTTKVVTPDEVRENLGLPPLTDEQNETLNPPPPQLAPDNEGETHEEPPKPDAEKRSKKKSPFYRSTVIAKRLRERATGSLRY